MMIGRSACPAIVRTTSSVNAPAAVDSPISAVGPTALTTSSSEAGWPSAELGTASGGWASCRCAGSRSVRSVVTRPLMSTTYTRALASASVSPSETIALTICSHTPTPADPAPSMTTFCSAIRAPIAVTPAVSAASATAAVPWMSSLKVSSWSR